MSELYVNHLVRALADIRQRDYLSLQGMAHKLGISTGHLSMVFAGKRRPGLHFVRAALRAYPELRERLGPEWAEFSDT